MPTAPVAASTYLTPSIRAAAQTDQWREAIRQAGCDMRVAIPGIIQTFDAVHQTAVVQVALREKIANPYAGGTQDLAIQPLQDVPVVLPRGGGYALTLPLKAGDECLLVFADMCIDTWWQSGGVQNQFEKRRHDLSDAFCIPGPWNQTRNLSAYDTTAAQFRSDDGTSYVAVNSDGVKAQGINTVEVIAPSVTVKDSGVAQALVTDAFFQWFESYILPFLTSKGYSGPPAPINSETTVLKGQ